jgi:nucleotide-binding universal stress UspA family protein
MREVRQYATRTASSPVPGKRASRMGHARSAGRQPRAVPHEVIELVQGNTPTQDLLEVARQYGAEMIVIGIRRRSPVGKMILGSNAQEILLDADCPVLAVKAATKD